MNVNDRLDQIQARADAASPGPWEPDLYGDDGDAQFVGAPLTGRLICYQPPRGYVNAEFIAAARTDVPALVNALRAVLNVHSPSPGPDVDCYYDGDIWPCATVRAVDSALGGAS